jgi:hypothetical protein
MTSDIPKIKTTVTYLPPSDEPPPKVEIVLRKGATVYTDLMVNVAVGRDGLTVGKVVYWKSHSPGLRGFGTVKTIDGDRATVENETDLSFLEWDEPYNEWIIGGRANLNALERLTIVP